MSSIATALRRFIVDADRIFRSAKASFRSKIAKWEFSLNTLSKRVRSLGDRFAALPTVRRVTDRGEELVLMGGRVEAREFTSLLRTARSVEAYERATGTVLSPAARTAFEHLDDIARTHFPDAVLLKRARYIDRSRDALIERRALTRGERIVDARTLERIIREDPVTLKRVNALLSKTSKTRKLLYIGGTIAIAGVGLAYFTRLASEWAANNTGCFMYTQDLANGTSKCRVTGCSCPITLNSGGGGGGGGDVAAQSGSRPFAACDETNLWKRMRVRDNECSLAAVEREPPYCVHCNWNETDPDSVDFVDRTTVPENAYFSCERRDALDAMHEIIGSTLDDLRTVGSSVTDAAKNSFASGAKVMPWLITGGALLVAIVVLAYLWRLLAPARSAIRHSYASLTNQNDDDDDADADDDHHRHGRF